jgi:hypothetical protein
MSAQKQTTKYRFYIAASHVAFLGYLAPFQCDRGDCGASLCPVRVRFTTMSEFQTILRQAVTKVKD